MKEHGLLCTASVALALHEGRQTQDRRPIKPQPAAVFGEGKDYFLQDEEGTTINCPVQVGDIFYVWETFCLENNQEGYGLPEFSAPSDGRPIRHHEAENDYDQTYDVYPRYRASEDADISCEHEKCEGGPCLHPWKPSIHMPRWASRTRKLVTGIRVEKVDGVWMWVYELGEVDL